jgi:hypothetical protein
MRTNLPAFVAGALAATVLVAVPATALVAATTAADPHPTTFDGTSPTLTMGPVEFVVGASLDAADPPNGCAAFSWNFSIPLRMRWSGADATSGLAGYDVWGRGPRFDGFKKLVEGTSATTYDYVGGNYTGDCGEGNTFDNEFWVVSKDNRGNTATTNQVGQYVEAWQETGLDASGDPGLAVTRTGTWTAASCTCFNNGKTLYSTTKGASLSYKVTADQPGQTAGVVVEKNSNRGTINISVDGATATAVSTYAATATHRVIVWQKALGVGTHTIKLTNAGTSGRSRVDVDGIMLTRGPGNESPPELPQEMP